MTKFNVLSTLLIASSIAMPLLAQDGPPPRGNGNNQEQRDPNNNDRPNRGQTPPLALSPEEIELQLQQIIDTQNLQPIDTSTVNSLPVEHAKVQLGKKLFFTKNLGGEQSAACVSCHHPSLGGGDNLSLSVGVNAIDEFNNNAHDLLGVGRFNGHLQSGAEINLPSVPRNAPSTFNIVLFQRGLFWDSRVERLRNSRIATPDSQLNDQGRRRPDTNLSEQTTLAAAQARFPVTSAEEMRGDFASDANNTELRNILSDRLSNQLANISTQWPVEFSQVYGDESVTPDRIFDAIGEYERSMLFVNSPWNDYLSSNSDALTDEQKLGAVLFFTPANQGGAGCVNCHSGDNFSDERHHLVAFPQIGVGKGNVSTTATSQDFGRENITNNIADRYHFRTPALLNVEVTAPYGHSGAYQTLEETVAHYNNPENAIDRLFAAQGGIPFTDGLAPYCLLPQVSTLMSKNNLNCSDVFSDAYQNSKVIAAHLQQARDNQVQARAPFRARPNLDNEEINAVAAFLRALTDPCVKDRDCLAPWIIEQTDEATFPDDQPLIAIDQNGELL